MHVLAMQMAADADFEHRSLSCNSCTHWRLLAMQDLYQQLDKLETVSYARPISNCKLYKTCHGLAKHLSTEDQLQGAS